MSTDAADAAEPSSPVRVLVVVASTRAAAGTSAGGYEDRSGPVAVQALEAAGFTVAGPVVVPDGEPVEQAIRTGVASGYDVVLTSGGTGLSPTDATPEMTRRVIDREVPGLSELLRADGVARGVATAVLSRGVAGVAGTTLVVNLPGSTGGVRDGVAALLPVLTHAVTQLHGVDHRR